VSSRRYLEQLTTMGLAEVKPRYGTAGRPENGYVWSGARPAEAD
jgi:two-component system CitB family response regulator